MNMVIYKYELKPGSGAQVVAMPKTKVVVHVGDDPGGTCCIWAMVDPETPVEEKTVRIVGTGEPFDFQEWVQAITWVTGPFVWHLLIEKDFYS